MTLQLTPDIFTSVSYHLTFKENLPKFINNVESIACGQPPAEISFFPRSVLKSFHGNPRVGENI